LDAVAYPSFDPLSASMPIHFDNSSLAELDALHNIRLWTAPVDTIGAAPLQAFHCRYCQTFFNANSTPQQMLRHTQGGRHMKAKAAADKVEKEIDATVAAAHKRNNEDKDGGKGGGKGGSASMGSGSIRVIK
jgi:hypothetical protein